MARPVAGRRGVAACAQRRPWCGAALHLYRGRRSSGRQLRGRSGRKRAGLEPAKDRACKSAWQRDPHHVCLGAGQQWESGGLGPDWELLPCGEGLQRRRRLNGTAVRHVLYSRLFANPLRPLGGLSRVRPRGVWLVRCPLIHWPSWPRSVGGTALAMVATPASAVFVRQQAFPVMTSAACLFGRM
jgi:hypothetical protein